MVQPQLNTWIRPRAPESSGVFEINSKEEPRYGKRASSGYFSASSGGTCGRQVSIESRNEAISGRSVRFTSNPVHTITASKEQAGFEVFTVGPGRMSFHGESKIRENPLCFSQRSTLSYGGGTCSPKM